MRGFKNLQNDVGCGGIGFGPRQTLDKDSMLIAVDQQELFEEDSFLLQDHPAARVAYFHKMVEFKSSDDLANQANKRARRTSRATVHRQPLSADYMSKVRTYLHEGAEAKDLADRVTPVGKKKKASAKAKEAKKSSKKDVLKKLSKSIKSVAKRLRKKAKKNKAKDVKRGEGGQAPKKKTPKELAKAEGEEFKKGPLVGKVMRVATDRLGERLQGLTGAVSEQRGSLLTLTIVFPHGTSESIDFDKSEVVPVKNHEPKPLEWKSLNKLHTGEWRWLIRTICGTQRINRDSLPKQRMLTDEDLQASFELLQYQYQRPEVRLASPSAVAFLLHDSATTEAGLLSVLQLKEEMKVSRYFVVPIWSPSPLHWTVLELDCGEPGADELRGVTYYDWLSNMADNRARAQIVLNLLGGDLVSDTTLPGARNYFRQARNSNDCGLVIMDVLEDCMRGCRGEPRHCRYPTPSANRTKLSTMWRNLKKAKGEWTLEEATDAKGKVIISVPGEPIDDRKAYNKKVSQLEKEGKLKKKAAEYYTCGSCRWTDTGDGCLYCNPAKHEANLQVYAVLL